MATVSLIQIFTLLSILTLIDANLVCIAENWRTNSVKCKLIGSQTSQLDEITVYGNRQNVKVNFLYMKACKLRNLSPTVFAKTPDLHVLDLSLNKITNLDEDIFKGLTELRALNLSANLLKTIKPKLFSSLTKLSDLDLSLNFLTVKSQDDIFQGLTSLHTLDLSFNNDLQIVPDLFEGLNLKSLIISNANVELPDTYVMELSNLIYLDVSQNGRLFDTKTLSTFLESSINLVELMINSIGLEVIESTAFRENHRLRIINMSDNNLTNIDADLFSRNPTLIFVDVSRNLLESLPGQLFRRTTELLELNAANNKIQRLGANIFDPLIKLQVVNLSNNRLMTIQNGVFAKNTNLTSLDLSGNRLQVLNPLMFGNKPALKTLNLGHNLLSNFSQDILKNMKGLSTLHLDNNKLKKIPFEVINNAKLANLSLSCNEFVSLPDDSFAKIVDGYKTIDLYGNPWDCGCLNRLLETVNRATVDIGSNSIDGQSVTCVVGASYTICNVTQNPQDYKSWLAAHKFSSKPCISKL